MYFGASLHGWAAMLKSFHLKDEFLIYSVNYTLSALMRNAIEKITDMDREIYEKQVFQYQVSCF